MQPPPPIAPRGVTVGIAVQLFGLAVGILGLSLGSVENYFSTPPPNPVVTAVGAAIVFVGLLLHIARI